MTKTILAALTGTALLTAAAPSVAAQPLTEFVRYSDLDLAAPGAHRILADRLAAAADHVCPGSIGDAGDQARCRSNALSVAHDSLHKARIAGY